MMLEKCFLDTYYCDALALLVQKEGKVNEKFPTPFNGPERMLLENTLRLLVLYEKLDSSSFPILDDMAMDYLKDNEIIDINNYMEGQTLFDKEILYWDNSDRKLNFAKDISRQIILNSKEIILSNFLYEYPMYTRSYSTNYVSREDLDSKYESILNLHHRELQEQRFLDKEGNGYSEFVNYLLILLSNVEKGVYFSSKEKMCYINSFLPEQATATILSDKLIENVYYTIKINFKDEILILPQPHNLDDVLRMRESRELARFRKIMSEWLKVANEGNEVLMKKIQKDIGKANKELKVLDKIAVYKQSPLNFWINSIGGHIPYLSNVITLLNTFEGIYSYSVHKKDDWILYGK